MKNIWNKNSKLLCIVCIIEIVISLYCLLYFGYMDRLNYSVSSAKQVSDLSLLIQNMYTSTWWALIICIINLISIFCITSIIYKKQEYHFVSILMWLVLFLLALDLDKSIIYNISGVAIFIPIIVINIIAYKNQKSITKKKK